MTKLPTIVAAAVCLSACLAVSAGEASGPPAPVPYRRIPDPPDDVERHIVVKAQDRGPVWLLTGFLGNDNPAIDFDLTTAVKPKHWRTGFWPFWYPVSITADAKYRGRRKWGDYRDSAAAVGEALDRLLALRRTGMTLQIILHHKGSFYGNWGIKADDEDMLNAYYQHIYTLVAYCRHMGVPIDYWELQNEPPSHNHTSDNPGGYTFKGAWQDYLAAWDRGYQAVRAAHPEAKIVGPSFGGVGGDDDVTRAIDVFLAHCQEKGQRLDVLSWHFPSYLRQQDQNYVDAGVEIQFVPDRAHRAIEEVRNLVETKYPRLGIERYHIDEWGRFIANTGPGTQMAIFHYFDLAGVAGAAKAIWTDNDLCGILVGPKTPRTSFWCWVEYAGQEGGRRLVSETNDRCVIALASRDDGTGVVRAIVARAKRFADTPDLPPVKARIDFEGLEFPGDAEVTILRLGPQDGPLWEEDLEELTTCRVDAIQDGTLTLLLDEVHENQVCSITIAPPGTRARDEAARTQRLQELAEKEGQRSEKSERQLHLEAMALALAAADEGAIRINCGTPLCYTDPEGNGWFADRAHEDGKFGRVNGGTVHRGQIGIAGTENPEIYRSELWGQSAYRITVPNGKYNLRLHWAETYGLGPGGRTFDVVAEGKTILKNFDAAREAGGIKKAAVKEIEVEVTDGVLDMTFPHEEGVTPMINGIEVIRE